MKKNDILKKMNLVERVYNPEASLIKIYQTFIEALPEESPDSESVTTEAYVSLVQAIGSKRSALGVATTPKQGLYILHGLCDNLVDLAKKYRSNSSDIVALDLVRNFHDEVVAKEIEKLKKLLLLN